MKEHGILFSTPMVQAVLNGTKTHTRRVVAPSNTTGFSCKKKDLDFSKVFDNNPFGVKVQSKETNELWRGACKWQVGDRLYVKETFTHRVKHDKFYYKANHTEHEPYQHSGWKPSIFMPKRASRIWLEITSNEVENLQDITDRDSSAEGIKSWMHEGEMQYYFYPCNDLRDDSWLNVAKTSFYSLWRSINGEDSWQANPHVWVIKFKVLSTNGYPNT